MYTKYSLLKIMIPTLIGIALISSSCRKSLYQGPISATYGAEFWTSQSSVEQASLAMYGQLRSNLRATYGGEAAHFVTGDLVAGTFLPVSGSFLSYSLQNPAPGYAGNKGIPYYFKYVPYWENVLLDWSRFYQLIAQANLILQNVPKMPASLFVSEQKRNQYLAEALFMRSYAYFYMIRIWGDPVYVNQLYSDIDYGNIPPLARTAESIVLDSCLNDLKKAANFMATPVAGSVAIRANAGSNAALTAQIYAWKHQYDSAHVYCQKVINNYSYSLEPMASYTNLWKGLGSNENIFELAMQLTNNDPNFKQGQTNSWTEAQFNCFATFLKGPAVANSKTNCWIAPLNGIVNKNLFIDSVRDVRFKTILQYTPATGVDKAGYMLQKYTSFSYQDSVKKILPYINNNLVLMRLSDIYLLDAEALAMTGDLVGASTALSKTEIRAGINSYLTANTQIALINEIVAERGRELIGEGQWFYDLIRTESILRPSSQGWLEKVGYRSDRTDAISKGYYWPLNMTTLFPQDNLLTQNPYFTNN